jgi:cell volume regulation protein A
VSDVIPFGFIVGITAIMGMVAVLSNRVSERIRIPAPAIFLISAAIASDIFPVLGSLDITIVQRVVTVALIMILFDGGMHIGWKRFRGTAGSILWIGVAGTLVTAAAVALVCHLLFGLDWLPSMLIGTALAPTDPAVVFSVLGKREVKGPSSVILEGESGANDPVGIALLASLLAAFGLDRHGEVSSGLDAIGVGLEEFGLQMVIGAAVGVAAGMLLVPFVRNVRLPSEGLYPLRTLAAAFATYGIATVAHGSGFLAVFIAGILLGDTRAPYKREIRRFHGSLASLGEIIAFTVLGLTISLKTLGQGNTLLIGLVLAVLLAFVVRPLFVGALLLPVRLTKGERIFVLFSGLKGAVPILLGTFVLATGVADSTRIYGVIFIVVAFSVIVQGSLVPSVARWCHVPMRIVEQEPWSLGVRLRHEPHGMYRYIIKKGAPAAGRSIDELDLGEDVWISMLIRDGQLVPVRGDTVVQAGDEVLALTDPEQGTDPGPLFTAATKSPEHS